MTAGVRCNGFGKFGYFDHRGKCVWHHRVISWLRAAFPSAHVVYKARAVQSTDSFFAMSRFQDSLEGNHTVDLAFFDSCK